ncbi:MAG TPA: PQQ-binding-like beta-propeller repeat protein, partial [Acidimicrobiales bacterium]|nr:PQQ-binding-like beta-propeller repeat protein [Acidimicrobiales bacterium]
VLDPTTGKLQRLVSGMSGNKFAYPSQIVSNGKLVFVLNLGQYDDYAEVEYNDPVDSVDPSSGKIVKSYYAEYDSTIAVSGSRLFQAYEDDSASNEQHPAGVWSDVVANGRTAWFASTTNYAWYNPTGMIVVGRYLFVADTGRVTQLVSRTGAMVRELAQIPHIPFTDVMASTEGYLFVANIDHSVSQINVASGERVRVIPSSEGNLEPTAMAAHGGNVYIVNANDTVTEIDPGTGALVRQFAGPAYGFSSPSSIAFFQNTMEILNTANISVTIVPGVR